MSTMGSAVAMVDTSAADMFLAYARRSASATPLTRGLPRLKYSLPLEPMLIAADVGIAYTRGIEATWAPSTYAVKGDTPPP